MSLAALKRHWSNKLAKSGFVDAERDGKLIDWHSFDFVRLQRRSREAFEAQQLYYQLATDWVHIGAFDTPRDKEIWTLHANGYSGAIISAKVGLEKSWVNKLLYKLRVQMLQGSQRANNY